MSKNILLSTATIILAALAPLASAKILVVHTNVTEHFFSGQLVNCGFSTDVDFSGTSGSYATIMKSNEGPEASYVEIAFTKKELSLGTNLCSLMDKQVFVAFNPDTKKVEQVGTFSKKFQPDDQRIRPQTK